MKKELFISTMTLIALTACSESEKAAGGTIEDNNASLEEWFNYGLDWKESAYAKIDGGKIAMAEGNKTGSRAECTADSATFAMTIQIEDGASISTQQATGLGNSCDSIYAAFKTSCTDAPNSEFLVHSDFTITGCKDGAFKAVCIINEIEDGSASALISDFSAVAAKRCSDMSKGAESSTGRYETPSSSSKKNEGFSSSSSVIEEDPITPQQPSDTVVTIDSSKTLENYVLQYASSAEQLSFDNHVIAYNGSPKWACIEFTEQATGVSTTDLIKNSPVIQINTSDIPTCFPMTAKLMSEHPTEKECRYFMTLSNDGTQPTGHVLSNITNDELEFTSAYPSGMCARTNMFQSVFFLIEDCNNEINPTDPQTTHKSLNSEIWKCEDGQASPSPIVYSYMEWFSGKLIKE